MHSSGPGFRRISDKEEQGLEALSALVLGARREGLAEAREKAQLKEAFNQGKPACQSARPFAQRAFAANLYLPVLPAWAADQVQYQSQAGTTCRRGGFMP